MDTRLGLKLSLGNPSFCLRTTYSTAHRGSGWSGFLGTQPAFFLFTFGLLWGSPVLAPFPCMLGELLRGWEDGSAVKRIYYS